MRRVAIIGTGHSTFMQHSNKTQIEMLSEVAMDAISEANVKPKDIQAVNVGNVLGELEENQGMVQSYVANDIGCFNVPANRFEGGCASGAMAIRDAFMLVASGFYDIVLAGGVEKASAMGTPFGMRAYALFCDGRYEFPSGFHFTAAFALSAHLYSKKYNVPLEKLEDQMATVAVQSHEYSFNNPCAQFHKLITKEDVLQSYMVSTPLRLLNCAPFSDGAAAVVLASEDVAKKLVRKPIYIAGVGQASSAKISSQYKYLPHVRARELSAKQAYSMAGLTPRDMDLCELHDCFSIASFIASECLGFFEYGTAGGAWERGETRLGGKIPINISGGLKGKGHPVGATGCAQVCEITRQLRGDMDEQGRQVEGAQYGITDTLGSDGIIVNIILSVK